MFSELYTNRFSLVAPNNTHTGNYRGSETRIVISMRIVIIIMRIESVMKIIARILGYIFDSQIRFQQSVVIRYPTYFLLNGNTFSCYGFVIKY